MAKVFTLIFAAIVAIAFASCASSPEKRFADVIQGMNGPEVRDAMGAGPTRMSSLEGSDYSSWYWGNDYCVLFKSGKVVGKDEATVGRNASIGPTEYSEKRPAECLAPGQVSQSTVERTVKIPGVGSAQLPSEPSGQRGGPTNPSPNGPLPGDLGGSVSH